MIYGKKEKTCRSDSTAILVVVVPSPFTDSLAINRRPALILSDESAFNYSFDGLKYDDFTTKHYYA
jgi:hypothetical protein